MFVQTTVGYKSYTFIVRDLDTVYFYINKVGIL